MCWRFTVRIIGQMALVIGTLGLRRAPGGYDPETDVWELCYLPDDFSQARGLSARHPGKLAELRELWCTEAKRNRALRPSDLDALQACQGV